MKTAKFLIQFTYPEETHWQCSPEQLADDLRQLAQILIKGHTTGTVPVASVSIEEKPEPVITHER